MAADQKVKLPPGFVLDKPSPPPGFVMDAGSNSSGIAPTLLESRQQASKSELERNQPESTLQSRTREYAIGLLEPFDLHNVPGLVENLGGALWDALSGKGTAKAQQVVKAAVTAPVEPVKEVVSGLASGDFDKAAHGAGGFASVTAPAIYGAAGTLERGTGLRPPSATATELYRTALKRGVKSTADVADVRQLAETGLKHNIPVSEAGAEKLQGLITDVEKEVQAHAQAATQRGVTVNKYKVASRLSPQAAQAAQQALPGSDLATISEAGNEFLAAHPTEIPADAALKIKQGTYRSVGDKAYSGEVVSSELTKAQKNLAHGFMEELANQVPEIAALTPEQSKMIGLNKVLEKAVNKQANLQGSVFRETVHGVAVGTVTGSPKLGVVAGALRHIWGTPEFRSKLAIAINKAQQNNPVKWGPPDMKTAVARVDTLLNSLEAPTAEATQ